MAFLPHLQNIVAGVDGAVACSVLGFDGIAVETHRAGAAARLPADLDVSSVWVEYASLLGQLRASSEGLRTGALREVSLSSERLTTVFRLIDGDYVVAVGLLPEGNLGKARYLLRTHAPLLKAELA